MSESVEKEVIRLFTWANLRMLGMVVAIVIVAQLASIPLSKFLTQKGLPR